VGMRQLQQRDPQDRSLERRDPPQRPPGGVARDQRVELLLVVLDRGRERPREVVRITRKTLFQRPAQQSALIQGPDPRAPLLGPSGHRRPPDSPRHQDQARETYSPERVSTLTVSPMLTNSGTWIRAPVSSTAGLVPPPEAVSPRSPGSVS